MDLIFLMIKNPINKAMRPIHIEVMIAVTVSNLFWNVLTEILLKYPRLRKIDSNKKHTNVVCKRNLQNDTLKNPKENWPGIDSGGVTFTMSSERKKRFFIWCSRYLRIEWFSKAYSFWRIHLPMFIFQDTMFLETKFLLFSILSIFFIPIFLHHLPARYHNRSPATSPDMDNIYTILKSKYHWAAKKAEIKLTIGHSKNISKNIIMYLYWSNNAVMFCMSI